MKKLIAACAIVALIFAFGCPQKKAKEEAKPATPETTMQAPAAETGAAAPPAETVKAPAPTPQPQPAPKPAGKPPKVGQ